MSSSAEIETRILPIHGIGELTVYDTALRIGAYLWTRTDEGLPPRWRRSTT